MPDTNRELVTALAKLWERYPHWRFGQLVSNVAAWSGEDKPGEVGEATDQAMLNAARAHLALLDSRPGEPRRTAV
jgi:hypothetical protein